MRGEVVDDVAVATDFFSVVIQGWAEVVAPMAGGEAVVFVEASVVGMVGRLCAVVPFAERSGGIAGGLEDIGDGGLIQVQASLSGTDTAHAGAWVVATGQELCACRGTDRTHIKVLKHRPIAGEGIHVRSGEIGVSIDAQVAPSLVVGEEDDDVWLIGSGEVRDASGQNEKEADVNGIAHGLIKRETLD